jgi:hypothetical protein
MNCNTVMEKIDLLVFEQDTRPDEEALSHIRTCPSCSAYLEESRRARTFMSALRRSEPILQNPEELTLNILQAVRNRPSGIAQRSPRTMASPFRLHLLERMLAAASVCLILVFGSEQYTVVDKITRLEEQQTTEARKPGLPVSSAYINTAGFSLFEAGKALRFRSTDLASSGGLFKKRISLIDKK